MWWRKSKINLRKLGNTHKGEEGVLSHRRRGAHSSWGIKSIPVPLPCLYLTQEYHMRIRSCRSVTNSLLRRSPWNVQNLKDLPLIGTLNQSSVSEFDPTWASHNVLVQTSLIQPHALSAGEQSQASVEDIIASEVYQSCPVFDFSHNKEINSSPDGVSGQDTSSMPL